MTRMEKMELLNELLELEEKNDIGNLTSHDRAEFQMWVKEALEQEPCREIEDYENEIEDLHNRLDIAEYDKERLREEVTRLEEKIKSLEQKSKWIPVDERLPDTSAWVLATYKDRDGDICLDIMIINEWTGLWESRFDDDDFADGFIANVIAWMPLPAPYEPQESEDN